ncbi:MAG: TonB-dependent receptor [Pseudomonadota bacterium]
MQLLRKACSRTYVLRAGVSLAALTAQASLAQTDASLDASVTEEIFITATKRPQTINDIPFSVAAFSEDELRQQGIAGFADLAISVPGLSLQEGGPGARSLVIRGISSTGVGLAGSTTGFYYDEAFVEPAGIVRSFIEPLFFDVERVEVLRGPQGTLFGGSSMGGTVRFISNKPDLEDFSGAGGAQLSFTKDGGANYTLNGMVNVPIVNDKLGVRLVGSYRYDEGFIDRVQDTTLNPTGVSFEDGPVEENVNDADYAGARAIVTFKPTETFTLQGTVAYQRVEQSAIPSVDDEAERYTRTLPLNFDELVSDEFIMGNLVATLELEDFEILSSTTYYDRDSELRQDGSNTFFSGGAFPLLGGGPREDATFMQEVRVTTTWDKPINFVAGVYYEDYAREGRTEYTTVDLTTGDTSIIPGFIGFTIADTLDRQQYAGFFEATYTFNEQWELTLGMRAFWFDVTDTVLDVESFTAEAISFVDGNSQSSSESGVSPRASLSYMPTDEQTYYATVSRGFRPGGPNFNVPPAFIAACQTALDGVIEVGDDGSVAAFESDNLWNFEVGGKTSWLSNKLGLNASAYYMLWDDIQQSTFNPGCPGARSINAGQADVFGVEIEFDVAVTDQFSVFGGINFNDAELVETTVFATEGTPIANAPEWTINLSARYEQPIGDFTGFALANYRYVSESFRVFGDFLADPEVPQGDFGLLGLRAGLLADGWQITAFVDNLTNDQSNQTRQLSIFEGFTPANQFVPVRPRTMGVEVRFDF